VRTLGEFHPIQHYVEDVELDGILVIVVVIILATVGASGGAGHPLLGFLSLSRLAPLTSSINGTYDNDELSHLSACRLLPEQPPARTQRSSIA